MSTRRHVTTRLMPIWLALLFLFGMAGASPSRAATYALDKDQTNVTFTWNHLGLSRQSARILDVSGALTFDPAEPDKSAIEATMKPASLWSGIPAFDRQLKSNDYFDIAQFPTVTFKSTGITKTGERTGDVTGDLTILGRVNPVTLQVTWNFTGDHPLGPSNPTFQDKFVSGFTATTKLLRSNWGMSRGTPLVSDEIEITINVEFIQK